LATSLRRLFREVGKELTFVDVRRMVVEIRRELCRVVSCAIQKIDLSEAEPQLHIVQHHCLLVVPVRRGFVQLVVHFAFFVSVGYVHMIEPVVRHQLV